MGVLPPIQTWDGGTPAVGRMGYPPSPSKCEQTENITCPHPSNAGGNKIIKINALNRSFSAFTDNGGSYADGGGGKNNPLRGGKSSLFEGGIRVPTFIVSPHIQGGTTNENLMHMSDWFPTLCNLAGVKPNGFDLDGYDVWETIR